MKSLILINFKVYPEAIGKKGILLSRKIAKVKSKKYQIAISPTILDVVEIARTLKNRKHSLLLFAQHSDSNELGAHTGSVTLEELKAWKINGVIINHSENRLNFSEIKREVEKCRKLRMLSVVCASKLKDIENIAKTKPDYVAYEPAELIGGNVSVTSANPKIILQAAALIKKNNPKTKLLCGAGIHSREDLIQTLKLGAQGVLLAHAVVKSKNPQKFLEEMLR
ncbi:MAG: triose-phosphate isomerase [Candidatus Woesearchaeota archaeon]